MSHQSFSTFFTNNFHVQQHTFDLNQVHARIELTDHLHLGAINVSEGKMLQQVTKRKNLKFLFQQVSPQGTYPFQVLDGIGQYGGLE